MGGRNAKIADLSSGDLRDLMTVESATVTKDSVGGDVKSWATLTTMWVKLAPYRGNRGVFGQQNRTVMTHFAYTQWFPTPVLTTAMRMTHLDGRVFQPVYWEDVDELHEFFYIELLQGVPT